MLYQLSYIGVSLPNSWSGRRESNPRPTAWKAVTLPLSYSRKTLRPNCNAYFDCSFSPVCSTSLRRTSVFSANKPKTANVANRNLGASKVLHASTPNAAYATNASTHRFRCTKSLAKPYGSSSGSVSSSARSAAQTGAQGRIRTSVALRAADLQSAAFNHSATCAEYDRKTASNAQRCGPLHTIRNKQLRTPRGYLAIEPTTQREKFLMECVRTVAPLLCVSALTACFRKLHFLELAKGFEPPTL